MPEENTEETTAEKSPEQSFAELRAKYEASQAELRPLKAKDAVTAAGFNPDTPEGKALHRLALAEDEVNADKVKALATELGFEAEPASQKHVPTANERAAQEFANRASELNQVTSSDSPQTIDDEIADLQAALAKARAAGQWDEARAIGKQLTALGSQKVFAKTMEMG